MAGCGGLEEGKTTAESKTWQSSWGSRPRCGTRWDGAQVLSSSKAKGTSILGAACWKERRTGVEEGRDKTMAFF